MATKKEETPMLDPVAYRSDYNPNNIKEEYRGDPNIPGVGPQNANLNYNAYGDDSNPAQQGQKGGLNPKYGGEGVSNTYIEYDPNLRTSDLDPNYLYGENARQQNRQEAGYIARRNDNIASALYNEGITDKEGVANYLSQQGGWMDSTNEDRLNTIDSIWKRMGQIKPEGEQEEAEQAEFDESRMEEGITASEAGKIYGKVTADEGNPNRGINTLADENNVFESMKQDRINRVKEVYGMSSEKIAYLMSEGRNPISEMTMRDLMEFYPEKYNEIQVEYKKLIGQTNVDNISMGGGLDVTSQLTANEDNVTTSMNYFVNSIANGSAAGNLSTSLNNALAESEIASTAREQREVYKRKIVEIQQSAESLEKDANAYFKGDTPDYIIKAFINNRMQKYNREIEKYQQLYNASLDEEKREVSQQQWNTEMAYKWGSLNADINYKNANLELSRQELAYKMKKDEMSNGQWNDDGTYSYIDMNGVMHTVPKAEAEKILNTDLYNKATSYIDYWKKLIDEAAASGTTLYGDQCEVMTDKYTNQFWGITMTKEDGTPLTLVEDKAKYVTDAIPERGFVAIWNYGKIQADGKNYGHTGIVIDYDPVTGIFTTLESNRKQSENGTPIVTIQEQSINSANLLGFWDPTKGTPWNRKGTNTAVDEYLNLPNGMLDVFLSAESHSPTGEERKYVKQGREGYGIINNMLIDGEIEAILSGDEIGEGIANAVDGFKKYLLENASNRMMTDEDGNAFIDTALQMFINSGNIVNPQERDALAHLTRLVEIKLRRDSGAAINIGEWLKNYDMYMPQIGLSRRQKMQRLLDLERSAIQSVLPAEDVLNYVPLITKDMVNNESDEGVRAKAIAGLKNHK